MTTPNSHLPEVFRDALFGFSPQGQAQLRQAKLSAYVKALQAQDWDHEMSDDHQRYAEGRESLAQLKLVQRELDSDGAIWNQHAPAEHRILMDVVTAAGFGGCNV